MNTEYFPIFISAIYPKVHIDRLDAIELGNQFKKYLIDKFKDKPNNLEIFWNIDFINVVSCLDHPTRIKGYHPALILHFNNFIKEMKNS